MDVAAFSKTSVKADYPSFELFEINDTLPVVVSALEKGDMPLIAHHNGQRKVVCRVSPSAFNVDKILLTQGNLKFNIDESKSVDISSVKEYLEVV